MSHNPMPGIWLISSRDWTNWRVMGCFCRLAIVAISLSWHGFWPYGMSWLEVRNRYSVQRGTKAIWGLCHNEIHYVIRELPFVIEVEVHQQLRAFLREQGEPYWPHHLTMARLVARALRLGRNSVIQAGTASGYHGRYRLSYLMPALIWDAPVILVVPEALHHRLLWVDIPRIQQWIPKHKAIRTGDRWPGDGFQGLFLTTPASWLSDRLTNQERFPDGIPTLLDGVDDLESWALRLMTQTIQSRDWDELMLACPNSADLIRDVRVQLTRSVFQHPENPYNRYLLDADEQAILMLLHDHLLDDVGSEAEGEDYPCQIPDSWHHFWDRLEADNQLAWVDIARQQGQFSLHCSPSEVATLLQPIWQRQPVVLIGSALDPDASAPYYRQRIGLDEPTCLKFSPDRQQELIQVYLPDRFPLPNTPQFQPALIQELRQLLVTSAASSGLNVILIGDIPLKAKIGSILAAEFGSRVQVERTCLDDQGILVSGWEFWQQHQAVLPAPHLLVMATLPIPSLEDPLVSGRVAHYKKARQDWFRLYLLPEALSTLQRAVAPVRDMQGVVALLDNRVNHRSYGQQVLSALSPMARINYVDSSFFTPMDCPIID